MIERRESPEAGSTASNRAYRSLGEGVFRIGPESLPPASKPDDAEVVGAVLAGDREAYGILIGRYEDVLYRYAERMTGQPDAAADVVQRTFIKAFRNLGRCRERGRVGGWMFRIAVNVCKDELKGRASREVPLEAASAEVATRGRPDDRIEQAEVREEIYRALQTLGVEQREAFVLKHVEGWSYEEMAEKIGVSVPALKMRVYRARSRLQQLLESYR